MTDSVCTTNPAVNQEVWKDVPGYSRYQVSNLGRVKSFCHKHPKMLKPNIWDNRRFVVLCNGNGKKSILVYRLVLMAFVGECPEGMEACHYDGNSLNDCLENLRWDTPKNNCRDKQRHGTNHPGETNPNSKLKNSDVIKIRQRFHSGVSQVVLAEEYKVIGTCIYKIVTGESYKTVGGPIYTPRDYASRRKTPSSYGEKCHFAKLKNTDIPNIVGLLEKGVPVKELTLKFNISRNVIYRIKNKQSWNRSRV